MKTLMTMVLGLFLLAPLNAAMLSLSPTDTFATIQPTTVPGEQDALVYVFDACPDCVRVSDQMVSLPYSDFTGRILVAFDNQIKNPDRDFNDLIVDLVLFKGDLVTSLVLAVDSAAEDQFWYNGTYFFDKTKPGYPNVFPVIQSNPGGLHGQVAMWYDIPPADPVPEPSTVVLFGLGLIGLALAGKRKIS